MATIVDMFITKQAQAELDKSIASLKLMHEEIIKINQQGLKINSGASPKNPQQMNSSVKESIALNERLEKQNEKLRLSEIKLQIAREKAIDKYNAKLEKQSQKQINESNKIIAQKEKEFAKFEKQFNKYEADLAKQAIAEQNARKKQVQSILDQSKSMQSLQNQREKELLQLAKEEAKLAIAGNYYNKLKAELNNLSFAYKDLATRQQMGANLSRVEAERMQYLKNRIKTLDTTLKGVDGAMANLNAKHQQAKKTLQDLIASQTASNAQIRKAQKEYDALDKRVVKANNAVRQFNYNVGNYPKQAISGIRNLVGAFGIVGGVSLFATIAQDIFKTTKELQSLDNALKQVSGTQEIFRTNQEFLRKTSEAFGLDINGLTKQFTQFYVSAKDKISGKEIEDIFTSVAKAGSVLGLSVENQDRAFLALNQMMSKGVVSAEELRGQLGEALPGAFGIMAKALNVNEQQLGKLMKDGKLLASEVLPKFAEALEKVYGIETIERVETLSASQNRLSNSWTEMIRSLNENETGGISQFFKTMIDGLNTILNLIIEANKGIEEFKREVYRDAKTNISTNITKSARENAQAIISGQLRRGEKPDNLEELTRIKEIEYASAELTRQKTKYIQALKDEESAEILLNIQKEKSKSLITGGIFNLSNLNKAEKAHQDAILYTQQIRGNIDGLMLVVNKKEEENTKVVTANTGALNKNNKASDKKNQQLKEEEKFILGSIGWFKQKIKLLEAEAEIIKKNSTLVLSENEEYQKQLKTIEDYNKGLERLLGLKKELNIEGQTLDLGGSEFITDPEGDELMKEGDELRAWYKDFREGFQDDFWANSGFDKINFIIENFDKLKESGTDMALAMSEAFQQAFNTISEFSNANYQQMFSNLERQRDVSILFAGESATAREEIERQYEERRKRIQRQQAESQKRLAMFNIAINTAQAIIAAAPKIPLMIAMGVIGAAQLAMTASQPIPQFYKGTQNAPEGLAWTDEKGAELHTDKNGKIKDLGSSKGARLKKLEKGDKIYTASQTKKMMDLYGFNQDFNNIMLTNGINTSNFNNNSLNLEPLNARLDRLTSVVANKSEVTIVNNESGTRYYERVNGQRRELVNSVLTMKSRTIR